MGHSYHLETYYMGLVDDHKRFNFFEGMLNHFKKIGWKGLTEGNGIS